MFRNFQVKKLGEIFTKIRKKFLEGCCQEGVLFFMARGGAGACACVPNKLRLKPITSWKAGWVLRPLASCRANLHSS